MTVAARGALTLAQAAFLATAGPSPFSLAVALVGAAAAWTGPRLQVPRPWILPLCLLPALAVLAVPADPATAGAFLGPGAYRVAVFVSLLASFLAMVRWEPGGSEQVPVAASVALMMAAGVTNREFPYGALVAAQAAALVLHFRPPGTHLVALVPLMVLAGSMAAALAWSETKVNQMMSWFTPPVAIAARFEARSKLDSMLDLQGSGRVVLRVIPQDEPPFRVVGAVYLRYEQDTWAQRGGRARVPREGEEAWRLATGDPPLRDEVVLTYRGAGLMFAPRGTARVDAPVYAVETSPDGVLFFTPPRSGYDGRYVLHRTAEPVDPGPLAPEDKPLYLQLPADLPPIVRSEAARLAPEGTPPREAALALESFFHEGFRYGLGYPFQGPRSPLEQFLVERPPAHCEFFATAMALMLRDRGIPSRYVTGFLVYQRNPVGGFYTVRENHAHAWVEAWIEGQGWVTYDPTPPGAATPPAEGLGDWLRQWTDLASFGWQDLVSRVLAGDWRGLLASLGRGLVALGRWLGLPALLLAAVWWARRRGRARRGPPEDPAEDPGPLRPLLVRLDGLLAARGLPRPASLTLLEWRERLAEAETLTPEEREAACAFLDTWCAARYARRMAEPEAERSLKNAVSTLEERDEDVRRASPTRRRSP